MARLPLEQGIPRFKANEERIDIMTNGDENATWLTADGTEVPSVRKMFKDINTEGEGWVSVAVQSASVATTKAGEATDAASVAITKAGEAADAAELSSTKAGEALASAGSAQEALDAFQDITAVATTLAPGSAATSEFNPVTGVLNLGIPRGYDGSGAGDMTALMYDPNGVEADAFSMDNMVEGATTKIMTSTERSKLSGIEAGAQVNTVTSVAGKTGAVSIEWTDITDRPNPVLKEGDTGLGSYSSVIQDIGNSSGANIVVSPSASNFKHLTNNGAFTLTAPSTTDVAYSVAILVTSVTGAGAMTATGFSDVSGDFDPGVDNLLSIMVIGSSRWLSIKAKN